MVHNFKDLTGLRFGRLGVLRLAPERHKGQAAWECACDCGKAKIVPGYLLRHGDTKSCGCLHKDFRRLAPGEAGFNRLLENYKHNATTHGRAFTLTADEFRGLTKGPCFYCGCEPELQFRCGDQPHASYTYNGIDRVDNEAGYTLANCVTCCETCNKAKRFNTVAQFRAWLARAYFHQFPSKEVK